MFADPLRGDPLAAESTSRPPRLGAADRLFDLFGLTLILAIGAFLRLDRLTTLPPGLHQDEAVYGLYSLTITLGQYRIFFGEREPLFEYLVAGMTWLVGVGPIALRLTAALVGLAAVLATYLAAREMLGRRTALLAGATIAVSLWPVMISRVGYRAGTLSLVEAAALACLWAGWRRESLRWYAAGGVLLGLTMYTYIAGRFFPLALAGFVVALLFVNRAEVRRRLTGLAVALGAAVITFAPLGYYFVRHPEAFFGRPAQVAAFGAVSTAADLTDARLVSIVGLRALTENIVKTGGMFFVAGDANWRHNLSGTPALLLPYALLLVLGYALALWRFRRPADALLAIWLPLMLLPSALSIDAPHYLRTIGAAPAAAILVGSGLEWLIGLLEARLVSRLGQRPRGWLAGSGQAGLSRWLTAVALVVALVPGIFTYRTYFDDWATRPETYRAYNLGLAEVGRYLAASDLWRSGSGTVFVTSKFYDDRASITYFLWPYLTNTERLNWNDAATPRVVWFDESRELPIPITGDALYILDATVERPAVRARLGELGLTGKTLTAGPLDLPVFTTYFRPAGPVPEPATPLRALGETGIDLVGYSLGQPAASGTDSLLALYWRVAASARAGASATGTSGVEPASIFCHLLGATDQTLAQADQPFAFALGQPAARADEIIVTWHQLPLPAGLAPGAYSAEIGLYDKPSGKRQQLRLDVGTSAAGATTQRLDSRAVVHGLAVTPGEARPTDVKPAQPVNRPLGAELMLLGLDRPTGPVAPGDRLPLTLYWQASQAGSAGPGTERTDYQIEIALRPAAGADLLLQRARPAAGLYPTSIWRPGEVVRDDIAPRVSSIVPPGGYDLITRAIGPAETDAGELVLGKIEVAGLARSFEPPVAARQASTTFAIPGASPATGAVAELVGYDLPTVPARAGGMLKLMLYWRSLGEASAAYTVFAHLIDRPTGEGARVLGQHDGQPVGGQRPTTSWVVGEYLTDPHELAIASDAQAGQYWIEIGLYDATTNQRLAVRDAQGKEVGDRLVLGDAVTVDR